MKTAISIPDNLFEQVNKLAEESNTSKSRIFCIAVREYLEKVKSQKVLDALNRAYIDEETFEEKELRKKSIGYYKKTVLEKNDNKTG